jgi:hypothetical protein
MEVARGRYLEQLRHDALDQQLKRWHQAQRIRDYAAAITARHGSDAATGAWVEWMQGRADKLDPLSELPEMPGLPDKIQPEDLRPYLKGRSPYGPDASY